jgi:hypothetical protein
MAGMADVRRAARSDSALNDPASPVPGEAAQQRALLAMLGDLRDKLASLGETDDVFALLDGSNDPRDVLRHLAGVSASPSFPESPA